MINKALPGENIDTVCEPPKYPFPFRLSCYCLMDASAWGSVAEDDGGGSRSGRVGCESGSEDSEGEGSGRAVDGSPTDALS